MYQFEKVYANLLQDVLNVGERRQTRNAITKSLFGTSLTIDMSKGNSFPLLLGRKMFYTGVFGEFAAFLRGPKHIRDFKMFGCNYWKDWAKPDGSINIDYGNKWIDFHGINQLAEVKRLIKEDPMSRRILIDAWDPTNLADNDLPCCHFLYQWYIRSDDFYGKKYLDLIWTQRSVDSMVGLPSDIILAALWNILLAKEVGLEPGRIKMDFGDIHIYESHFDATQEYIIRVKNFTSLQYPTYTNVAPLGRTLEDFVPSDIVINDYSPEPAIKLELIP